MKIRTDFVSNSSSSSYVFSANFEKYSFADFVKAVCDGCGKPEDAEDKRIYENNKAILQYCLRYFELLHLGQLVLGRKKEIVRRGYDEDGKKEGDDDFSYSKFESIKYSYIDHPYFADYDEEHTTAKMIDNDTIEYEYDDLAPSNIVVPKEYMSSAIRGKYKFNDLSDSERQKSRVDAIMKVIDMVSKDDDLWLSLYNADTYLITKNTIANTRDLIARGYQVRLDKWEDLDALEARLRAGETVFHIECGDSGEGESDSRLYSYDTQYPFSNIPLESIRSDN